MEFPYLTPTSSKRYGPCKITGLDLDRMASENTIESIEFSVGTVDKY